MERLHKIMTSERVLEQSTLIHRELISWIKMIGYTLLASLCMYQILNGNVFESKDFIWRGVCLVTFLRFMSKAGDC